MCGNFRSYLYVSGRQETYECDRSKRWRIETAALLAGLPPGTSSQEVSRLMAQWDQPKLVKYFLLSLFTVETLLKDFYPTAKVVWKGDIPALQKEG